MMHLELITTYSIDQLGQAASEGKALYSCERFEDSYGRLMVGIGAPLEGRALERVIRTGRRVVYASKEAMCDGVGLRLALRKMAGTTADTSEPSFDRRALDRLRKIVGICPEAEKLIARFDPTDAALNHAIPVATYARRIAEMFNHVREGGFGSAVYPYPKRSAREISLAGILHDIGKWKTGRESGHETRGAEILSRAEGNSIWLHQAREIVARHHEPPAVLSEGGWTTHKIIPIAVAEAIVESENRHTALCNLIPSRVVPELSIMLSALCNLENIIPSRSVVRLRSGKGPDQLAVSLRLSPLDSGPVLLRIATWQEQGQLCPLFRGKSPVQTVAPFLIGPGHPVWNSLDPEVVNILSADTYNAAFAQYEHLVPRFRAALKRQLNLSTS